MHLWTSKHTRVEHGQSRRNLLLLLVAKRRWKKETVSGRAKMNRKRTQQKAPRMPYAAEHVTAHTEGRAKSIGKTANAPAYVDGLGGLLLCVGQGHEDGVGRLLVKHVRVVLHDLAQQLARGLHHVAERVLLGRLLL